METPGVEKPRLRRRLRVVVAFIGIPKSESLPADFQIRFQIHLVKRVPHNSWILEVREVYRVHHLERIAEVLLCVGQKFTQIAAVDPVYMDVMIDGEGPNPPGVLGSQPPLQRIGRTGSGLFALLLEAASRFQYGNYKSTFIHALLW